MSVISGIVIVASNYDFSKRLIETSANGKREIPGIGYFPMRQLKIEEQA
jgi:hypothetical protein